MAMASSVQGLMAVSKEALGRGDVATIASLYHPNAALHAPGGVLIVGREAIADHFASALAQIPDDIEHETTEEHVHLVTPDLAIVDLVGDTFRVSPTGMRDVVSVEGFTMIAVRDDAGEWLWAGIRGALVPK
jgi:uncharacterized protein (TIGR02246 family)